MRPFLGVVIPLKSQTISKDWTKTCSALQDSLNSLLQQQEALVISVAGHEKPAFLEQPKYANIHFTSVNIPPPNRSAPDFSHAHLLADKNAKIVAAVEAIYSTSPEYWYQLDSDDCVHQNFGRYLRAHLTGMGAVLEGGFLYYQDIGRYITTSQLATYCGSTSILHHSLIVCNAGDQQSAMNTVDVPWTRTSHLQMHQFFRNECNGDYVTISEPLIAYILASGDNISDRWRNSLVSKIKAKIKPILKGTRATRTFKSWFALTD